MHVLVISYISCFATEVKELGPWIATTRRWIQTAFAPKLDKLYTVMVASHCSNARCWMAIRQNDLDVANSNSRRKEQMNVVCS